MKQKNVREIINKLNPLAPGERASTYEIMIKNNKTGTVQRYNQVEAAILLLIDNEHGPRFEQKPVDKEKVLINVEAFSCALGSGNSVCILAANSPRMINEIVSRIPDGRDKVLTIMEGVEASDRLER